MERRVREAQLGVAATVAAEGQQGAEFDPLAGAGEDVAETVVEARM